MSNNRLRELADMHGQCSLATRAWAADEIERLTTIGNIAKAGWDNSRERIAELQARVDELDRVRKAVLAHRDNSAFLNVDTWDACVFAAERVSDE